MMNTYSSSELSELAEQAPQNTLEEDIEALCQRDIAAFQLEFHQEVHRLIEASDKYIAKATLTTKDKNKAHAIVWQRMDAHFEAMRKDLNTKISALYALRDYRLANLAEWHIQDMEHHSES